MKGTANVIDACRVCRVDRLVYTSSFDGALFQMLTLVGQLYGRNGTMEKRRITNARVLYVRVIVRVASDCKTATNR